MLIDRAFDDDRTSDILFSVGGLPDFLIILTNCEGKQHVRGKSSISTAAVTES